jgi:hypothetical protein
MNKLQTSPEQLEPTGQFHGVNRGTTQPLWKITMSITFWTEDNYRTENVTFDVADIPLLHNSFLGRLALAQFMVLTHSCNTVVFTLPYNNMKMPSAWEMLTMKASVKDAMACEQCIYLFATSATLEGVAGGFAVGRLATGEGVSGKNVAGGLLPPEARKKTRRPSP